MLSSDAVAINIFGGERFVDYLSCILIGKHEQLQHGQNQILLAKYVDNIIRNTVRILQGRCYASLTSSDIVS